jgi:hypothetical protein
VTWCLKPGIAEPQEMSTARQWFHKHIPAAMDIYTTEELFITLRAKLVPVKIILYIKIFKYFKMMYYVA